MPTVNTDLVNLMIWNYMLEHGWTHSAYDFYHECKLAESSIMHEDKKIARDCLIKMLVKGSRYASEMFGESYNIERFGLLDASNRIGEDDWEEEKDDEEMPKTESGILEENEIAEKAFPLSTVIQLTGHEPEGVSCQWHPTEDTILTTAFGQETFARYWNLDTKQEKWSETIVKSSIGFPSTESCPLITYAKWSNKNHDICSLGDTESALHLHNKETRVVARAILDSEVRELCWSPSETEGPDYLVCATEGGEVYVFDCTVPAKGLQKAVQQFEGYKGVHDISFMTAMPGHMVVPYKNSVRLHTAATEDCLMQYDGHNDKVMGVKDCPREDVFASCSLDGTVKIWSVKRKFAMHTYLHDGGVSMLRWSPDKETLITLTENSAITIWNNNHNIKVKTIKNYSGTCCEYSHMGNMVAVGCVQGNMRVWDTRTNELVRSHTRNSGFVECAELSWSSDDKKIAAIFVDGGVHLYDMRMQPL